MTLRTLFAIPIAVILLVVLASGGMLLWEGMTGLSQGAGAVAAVDKMRRLVLLQSDLWSERVVSNAALGREVPLPEDIARLIAGQRARTNEQLAALMTEVRDEAYLNDLARDLSVVRAAVDSLLSREPAQRTYQEQSTIMPRFLAASRGLEDPLARASMDVVAADPGLSGLMTAARLTALLKDRFSGIIAVLLPRFLTGQALTAQDVEAVHVLWGQIVQLTGLLDNTIELANPPQAVRLALIPPRLAEAPDSRARLDQLLADGVANGHGTAEVSLAQAFILPWSKAANALRIAIVDAAMERVIQNQARRRDRLTAVGAAATVVVLALGSSLALLRRRVVRPLASLGLAITRIAAGDRRDPVALPSETREIAAMASAVETLRQAALVADASAMREREAEQRRLGLLREALAIVQTVREPAHALEDGIAGLCRGIEDAIALIAQKDAPPPMALAAAASAARLGLAEMRGAAEELEAMIASAHQGRADAWPEADIVAYILAVRAHVERRDAAVCAVIQPSLVALRDAVPPDAQIKGFKDLAADQFERIETAVMTVASMRAAVTRAGAILRDLHLETAAIAA